VLESLDSSVIHTYFNDSCSDRKVFVLSSALLLGVEGRTWPNCLMDEVPCLGHDENHQSIPMDQLECFNLRTQNCHRGGVVCEKNELACGSTCYDPWERSGTSIFWGNILCDRGERICGDMHSYNGKGAKCYTWPGEECCNDSMGLVCAVGQCDHTRTKCTKQWVWGWPW
jgi:hypothetical protein